MSKREKSDDFVGLGVQGIETSGIESSGSGWGGVGGKPTLSPSLDLQFATDKLITAKKGPTPVFARGSRATYFGLGVYVGSELLIPTGTSNGRSLWTIADASVNHALSYDGTRWVAGIDPGDFSQDIYYAANGSEWRPDKANWSASGIPSEFIPTEAVGDPVLLITAETNEPRFDHNPITGVCKGLLIEESRTNLIPQSETFDNATWIKLNVNTTGTPAYVNVAISPNGTMNAEKLIASSGLSLHQVRQDVTLAASTAYSISCFFKAGEQIYASIAAYGVGNGLVDYFAFFNLSTGATSGSLTGFSSSSITSVGNGWYRCVATFTSAVAGGALSVRFGGSSGTSVSYNGDGVGGIYLWGAQLEVGSFPTSYIPMTTGTAARSADVCLISGASATSLISNTEGSWSINFISTGYGTGVYGNAAFLMTVAGDGSNRISAYQNSTGQIASEGSSLGVIRFSLVNTSSVNLPHKLAFAYKVGETSKQFVDNISQTSSPTNVAFVMPAFTSLRIGSQQMTGADFMNGTISSFRYFRKRLPDAKLQTITV